MTTPLTFTHLRLRARADQTIHLGGYQGAQRLRDALAQVMMQAVCTQTPRGAKPTSEHAAVCPVCWLLAAETDPGAVRRAYTLAGPQPPPETLAPGEEFHFTLTLFGEGYNFLPYFVLAAAAMGEVGVGPGRGKFRLLAIDAVHPLRGESRPVLQEGERVVRPQQLTVTWEGAQEAAAAFPSEGELRLRFLSPMRLIESEALVKAPDFSIFFRHLLKRIDDLAVQHNGGTRRPPEEVAELSALANEVRLIEHETRWVELKGPSRERHPHRPVPMSGFVGRARYRSRHWERLLPFLLLGQGVQVGKLTAKGNGVFQVEMNGRKGYWE
ncbi:MAG: hypothetical protein Fur0043_24540 [Anaerolineales bacterium]